MTKNQYIATAKTSKSTTNRYKITAEERNMTTKETGKHKQHKDGQKHL